MDILFYHVRIYHIILYCPFCKNSFFRMDIFLYHVRIYHILLYCPVCENIFIGIDILFYDVMLNLSQCKQNMQSFSKV